jgi:lactate dehydrogenase-like 2-hydroxyacid dehydrogenase
MIRILYPDAIFSGEPDVERAVAGDDASIEVYRATSLSQIPQESQARADGIMIGAMSFGEPQLQHLPRCRIVIRTGVGYDTVDLKACGDRGIPVCNVPDFATTDVADHAIAMVLTLARATAHYNESLRANLTSGWRYDYPQTIRRLRDLVLGIVGLGATGTASALRGKAFGMSVQFFDPYAAAGLDQALGIKRAPSFESLLGAADVITIHVPLTEDTRGMINAHAIARMRLGTLLVNTARGAIVDTSAVLEGIRSGHLGGVGLDVLPKEPADLSDPLVAAWKANEPWIRGRVILSPHAAFFSPASLIDQRRKSVEAAMSYLRDGALVNCVNARFLQSPRN